MICRNKQFRALALKQGPLAPGRWPIAAFSGTTGVDVPDKTGPHAVGWRHDYAVNETWIKDVYACYATRPGFYDGAPCREFGYVDYDDSKGSRPKGWVWSEVDGPNDSPAGPAQFDLKDVIWDPTKMALYGDYLYVSGLDGEHYPLSPLIAVYDATQSVEAMTLLRYLGMAHAGMLLKESGILTDYTCSDRPAHYILRTLVDLGKRGLLSNADSTTLRAYVDARLLPKWEAIPVVTGDKSDPFNAGQTYNGLFWVLPALYDYAVALPPGSYRRRVWAICQRMSKQMLLLESLVPGKGCAVQSVDTWIDLTAAGIHFPLNSDGTDAYYFAPWGVRALDVTGVVLGIEALRVVAKETALKWAWSKDSRPWLVNAQKEWMT